MVSLCPGHLGISASVNVLILFPYQNYFIKFGDSWSFLSEMAYHKYLVEAAATDLRAPRIAHVYHVFSPDGRIAYAIIERITLVPTSPAKELAAKSAEAVFWIQLVQAPEDLEFGPVGGA